MKCGEKALSYIQVQDVCKIFTRNNHNTAALNKINLNIEQGKFISLLGPSGCGKSTLLRIIGGLVEAESGSVLINNQSPREAQKSKSFAFVPQSPALFPWRTILQNMNLPHEVNREATEHDLHRLDPLHILKAVGLEDVVHHYPGELSGGMQQRVGIARAFSTGAPILLMDEPFSALDEINREKMRYQLLDIWEKHQKTVVFVTHSIREAVLLSDEVIVMAPGKIDQTISIDLPRPRLDTVEESEQFQAYVSRIRKIFRQQ